MSRYKIGDISRLLGLSSEALRHYERQGIVLPKRDGEGGYRYYDTWDMTFLMNIIYYRSFGFALSDVDSIINDKDLDGLTDVCRRQEEKLKYEIEQLQKKLRALSEYEEKLGEIEDGLGKFQFCRSPELIFQCHRVNDDFEVGRQQEDSHRFWVNQMPEVNHTFLIPNPNGERKAGDYYWGFSRPAGGEVSGDAECIQSFDAVHTVFQAAERGTFFTSFKEQVIEPMKREGYAICPGRSVGHLLARVHKDGKMVRYYEAWIPAEKR